MNTHASILLPLLALQSTVIVPESKSHDEQDPANDRLHEDGECDLQQRQRQRRTATVDIVTRH